MSLEKIRTIIDEAQTILLVTHVGPDGDALGSITAMGQMLHQFGKQVTLGCDDNAPSRFHYLPLVEKLQSQPERITYDLLIALDCGDERRMGKIFEELPEPKPPVLNIDHHVTNTHFGEINHINADATSTAEMLYYLFRKLEWSINEDIALSLLTGLVTDTLGFRTVNVTSNTLRIGSELMEAGANLSFVTTNALNLKPMSSLDLWRVGLLNMKLEEGFIWTVISNEERQQTGHASASTAGLVNFLSDVNESAMSAVLMEGEDGKVRVGFRCYPPYSVSELAMNLGGGGHALAAGCLLDGPLADAESLVVKMSKDAIAQQRSMFN